MRNRKTLLFIGDGMADEPVAEFDGKTPLQYAATPAMDCIAARGSAGTLLTLPQGFPTGSEVATLSILGCDLSSDYHGRAPLEAAGRNIPLGPEDKAFRLNLATFPQGEAPDFSAGHPDETTAHEAIRILNEHFGEPGIRICPGVSYRNLVIFRGPEFSHAVDTVKPDTMAGRPLEDLQPGAQMPEAEKTAAFLRRLIAEAPAILRAAEFNRRREAEGLLPILGVWPWGGGPAHPLQSLAERYGITSAVISAVDVVTGLGRCLGMDVIEVEGATGYIDTNYEGKADAAVAALQDHDFVVVHVEATDEISHELDVRGKVRAIEDFDSRLIARAVARVDDDTQLVVLPDHPTSSLTGGHMRTPVPVAVRTPGRTPDDVRTFDEVACPMGALGAMENGDLMRFLFP